MNRTAINPWPWSLDFGYNQGEILEGTNRQLFCAGQTAMDGEGKPQHAGDMRGQMVLSLANLEAVLKAADMNFANIVRLSIYSTDVDRTREHFDVVASRLGASGVAPPMSLLGVSRLAIAPLMFEIEAVAMD